ncbi:TonB-dependent receptor [Pedobacter boryungensis]|uniref:TonB-dependent receptor n=1 Tax=Pedobacter boryungensis TaxID=869962 RepID=A0ABX2DDW7_9SPHI|nr:TonB-dependent receptor [Pedobacter boryungensis]NQX32279.1 TonB-dependent receptor [Pedobacter boryungensis]
MSKLSLTLLLALFSFTVAAQVKPTDSVKKLNEVTVKGYYNPQPLLRSVGTVSILDSNQIQNQSTSSLIGLINTAPGVRMEERSPGSYRLSLRGSLLRSPFGIRNIKIYIDDFPFTDAGGNSYLNSLDATAISAMEIYKGPQASIFGANTGGAVLITSPLANNNQVEVGLTAGSYGLFHQNANLSQVFKNYKFNIVQGYQQSDGYRENSALKRKYIQTSQQWDYLTKGQLKAFLLYSDLDYQTPGGLTVAQLAANPKAARPATPTLPGAVQQQAGIFNKTFFGGLSNSYSFTSNLKHVIALYTAHTDFKNPFITNYEKRTESTIGLRTFIEYAKTNKNLNYTLQGGLETASTKTNINNFGNTNGSPSTLLASDHLKANQSFTFLRLNFDIQQRLLVEVGSSLNFYGYNYQSYFPLALAEKEKTFKKQLMPKLAASYLVNRNFTVRASASKGYSPPTLAEVRSSDNVINTNLQAEAGWNYESGLRYQTTNKRIDIDATVFYFNLKDAIVRRLNTNDVEYFINAGGTKQLGTEFQVATWLIEPTAKGFINGLQLRSSYTYSHFRFDDFKNALQDYSGNKLSGVPTYTIVSSLLFNFDKGFYLFAQHNYTAAIPLNDANTVFAKPYHLADVKAGMRNLKIGKVAFDLSFGVNNLFNQSYSLGNDLNAANNRYFNAAARINYYTGLVLKL